jgi:hypothetical protein
MEARDEEEAAGTEAEAGPGSAPTLILLSVVVLTFAAGLLLCWALGEFFGGNSFVFLAASLLPASLFGGVWLGYQVNRRIFPPAESEKAEDDPDGLDLWTD